MTTREFVPRLDRQITRIVKGASPGINPLGNPLPPTSETEIKVWAGRRDFSGRDFSQVVQGGIVTIRDTRYIVRAESGPWAAGGTLIAEDGETLVVQGVEQLGRQYLEILARSGGL
jgi:hypothetical protein